MTKTKNKKMKKINTNKTIKKLNCSPKHTHLSFTCYSEKSLHKLKKYWNARHPDLEINSNDNREIWNKLRVYLSHTCDNERCWLQQKFMKNKIGKELLKYTFAPNAPAKWKVDPNTWLNSLDIERVMNQYEHIYPNFDFIGPSPIDFNTKKIYGHCVWDELCKFNLSNLMKQGKDKIGVIFNTDPHYKPGEHWIALFVNIKQKYILFFNSTGEKPPKEIKQLIKKIKHQGKENGINFKYLDNRNIYHQTGTTECGIYTLYMIIELLKGTKDVNHFLKMRIPDSDMEKLRKVYFN